MKTTKSILAATICISLAGCATKSADVTASYVSPSKYDTHACSKIVNERNRVVAKANELTGIQDKKAKNDAVAMGVGLVLFWPALFFLATGSDVEPQLAQMKGEYDALTEVGIRKGCFDA